MRQATRRQPLHRSDRGRLGRGNGRRPLRQRRRRPRRRRPRFRRRAGRLGRRRGGRGELRRGPPHRSPDRRRLRAGRQRVQEAAPGQVRDVLRDQGVDLLDQLKAILGPNVEVQAHGDRREWVGLMLDHQLGRFSEASMSATAAPEIFRADVDIFGPGAGAALDCTRASGPHVYRTMYREFADAIRSGGAPALDNRHGLHLQRAVESAYPDVLLET